MENKGLFFTKLSSISTVSTVFALWLAVYFSNEVEDALGYILILSVGILHGANDLKLIQKISRKEKVLSFKSILGSYILGVLLTALSFFVFPSVALLLFVGLSAYHFGEQHWVGKLNPSGQLNKLFYLLYGLVIFNLLFFLNAIDTAEVIFDLTGFMLEDYIFKYMLVFCILLLIIIGVYSYFNEETSVQLGEELFLLGLFFIIFKMASLIWAFSIYFIFWHSLPSLINQIQVLYGQYSTNNVKRYVKSSFLYWCLAIIGLGLTLYIFRSNQSVFISLFFAFLAAITVPHVFVMYKVLK
ncbi:MAG: beta-carotene 15,15'-dioxygenase, Brp/Blh family [Flavobacteriaceae bacterium]|nr:Brp/Blh family beta-carotene 15,15'-dioxygenase [Bacteroidia bacterium]NNL15717.1 beta-carotene 15,15'-dioxygenase, Brp/Blh family [Flavobacteriaceae bacterium]